MDRAEAHRSVPCHYCGRETVGFDRHPIAEVSLKGVQLHLRCSSCGWCFRLDVELVGPCLKLVSRANIAAPEGLSQLDERPIGVLRERDPLLNEPVQLCPTKMKGRFAGVPGVVKGPLARAAERRPANFHDLDEEEKWAIDKRLGILDWDGSQET